MIKEVNQPKWASADSGAGVHKRILFSCEGKRDNEIYRKMDGTGNDCVKGANCLRKTNIPVLPSCISPHFSRWGNKYTVELGT